MPDKLDKKLTNIEEKLGGTESVPAYVQDRLGWHLDYIESLIGGSGGDVQLKTLNNEELKGEGNIEIPVVAANPETTGEETKLDSLQVGDDKFLLGGSDVEAIELDKDATALEGLKIGDTSYRLLPLGTPINAGHIAIGINSKANGQYSNYGSSIAIGSNSYANNHGAIAIGRSSTCNASNSVAIGPTANAGGNMSCVSIGVSTYTGSPYTTAIGPYARAEAYNSVAIGSSAVNSVNGKTDGDNTPTATFDSDESSGQRIFHIYDATKIFFRNDYSLRTYKKCTGYTSGHFLSEYIQNNTLIENSGNYYIEYTDASNYKTLTKNVVDGTATDIDKKITGVHITIKASGSSSHSVVGLDLLLFDATNNYGFNSYGRIDVDGTVNDISATINSNGLIVINAPSGLTIDEVLYNIR